MNSFAPGSRFARHVIGAGLGRGGMGIVYRATHVHLQREVALKILSPRVAADDQFRARFRREAEAAASVHHPNVVPVYDAGEDDGLLYVTMRFVEGVDLARLIAAEERLPAGRAARLVAEVAAALDAAHARGVLHRDVKPANVLIEGQRESEHALLTDFGLTKILHAQTSLTETGALLGTIDYAAPELLSDDHVDARTDVYGLGCVLYEALTGEVPYPRKSAPAKIFAHLEAPVPALSATLPEASPELEDVVRCALAKDPDDRFTSAGELGRAALDAVTQPSRPRPARVAPDARTEPALAARPNRRRRRRVGALLVLGTVVGVAVGMLTLGDRAPHNTGNAAVAPNTASAAVAPSDDAYRAGVVSVCRAVNA